MLKPFTRLTIKAFLVLICTPVLAQSQVSYSQPGQYKVTREQRQRDSLAASRIPVLHLPESHRNMALPPVVDNSHFPWSPPVVDQYNYYSCQQYCAISYVFAYEIDRLRNVSANLPENRYSPHYTWNFFNNAEQYTGANFLYSFDAIKKQGQINMAHYGTDTGYSYTGWVSGYDNYLNAMTNRIRKVWAIPVNTDEGILTLKHFLNDHLDGSSSGGIACFTASSPYNMPKIPDSTPEGGKDIIAFWYPEPTHGMTITGYNDSVRYDFNGDGQFTNDIDLNGDGVITCADHEIGAFRFINSYGTWWADAGYCYVTMHAMASNFEQGGVWNNCVYVVEPDPSYEPLLTAKISMRYDRRNEIRLYAGISADTSKAVPEFTLEMPYFNFQGGEIPLSGGDSLPAAAELEFGLDLTPLLSYSEPGKPSRIFLGIEEKDPYQQGFGVIHDVSFNDLQGQDWYNAGESEVPIADNSHTLLSAVIPVSAEKPVITTEKLSFQQGGGSSTTQMEASGGEPPYRWCLPETYAESSVPPDYLSFTGWQIYPITGGQPFVPVALSFPFTFYGKVYDSAFINRYGFLCFRREVLPYPYMAGEKEMLQDYPVIAPAFSAEYTVNYSEGDGQWMKQGDGFVSFRWKLSLKSDPLGTNLEFTVTLYTDGKIGMSYGPLGIPPGGGFSFCRGLAKGDGVNIALSTEYYPGELSGQSFIFQPQVRPASIIVDDSGLLTLEGADSTLICDIPVRVTDDRGIFSSKVFQLAPGLRIEAVPADPSGVAVYNEPCPVKLTVTNTGTTAIPSLRLALRGAGMPVSITDSICMLTDLKPGVPVEVSDAFVFTLSSYAVNKWGINLRVSADAGSRKWHYPFVIPVAAPEILVDNYRIDDGDNHLMDPGEIADLEIMLINAGALAAHPLTASLTGSADTLYVLPPSEVVLPEIAPDGSCTFSFRLKAIREAAPGSTCTMVLNLVNDQGIAMHKSLFIRLVRKPVAVVDLSLGSSTPAVMEAILDSLNVSYDSLNDMPEEPAKYTGIFLILGNDPESSYMITEEESDRFFMYLQGGGNLYLESYSTWFYGQHTSLSTLLNYTSERTPYYYFRDIIAADTTFAGGTAFKYKGQPDYSIFTFDPAGSAYPLFTDTNSAKHPVILANPCGYYRTINSLVEFGKLVPANSPSSRGSLMEQYLGFFGIGAAGPHTLFHAENTRADTGDVVQFTDDSFDSIRSWQWSFPGGTPGTSSEQNPGVTYEAYGDYGATLTVSDGIHTRTLTRESYVHITPPEGTGPVVPAWKPRVYPNPATDRISIPVQGTPGESCVVTITDISGRQLLDNTFILPSSGILVIPVSWLRKGLYLVSIKTPYLSGSTKFIIP